MIRAFYNFFRRPKAAAPPVYLKRDPFELYRLRVTILFSLFAVMLIGYVLSQGFSVFGKTLIYKSTDPQKNLSLLGPKERIALETIESLQVQKQINDLVYFSTKMPHGFDRARVKVIFKNPSPNQTLSLGFKDQPNYHYQTITIDAPLINRLVWPKTGTGPYLYHQFPFKGTVDNFFINPPPGAFVGIFDFDKNLLTEQNIFNIDNYKPGNSDTVIDVPLRGKVIFYAYVKDEPFKLIVEKQDLNRLEDPDDVSIKIYKENENVYTATISDDGITDKSAKTLFPQEADIKNPGPGLPEAGVYKIVIDANSDTVIKKITTNLHKIVFETPLFPVANSDAYPQISKETKSVSIFTNALEVSASIMHREASQSVVLNDKTLDLIEPNIETLISAKEATPSANGLFNLEFPKSDVLIKGLGYFAFSQSQFFEPSKFKIQPISQKSDLSKINYLLTDYVPWSEQNGWLIAERSFDIQNAFIDKGSLSWILKAPGLAENGNEIIIKEIEVELVKNPIIDFGKWKDKFGQGIWNKQ